MTDCLSTSRSLPLRLAERLRAPLPGRQAQAMYEPELGYGRHFDRPPQIARQAVVMIWISWDSQAWRLPLIIRPIAASAHAGQVALPGGRIEPGESPRQAAIRETQEEIGAAPGFGHLLGTLSPLYLFNSGFYVVPFLAISNEIVSVQPCPGEVAAVQWLHVGRLLTNTTPPWHTEQRYGITFRAPGFELGNRVVWGATAMILGELAWLMREINEAGVLGAA